MVTPSEVLMKPRLTCCSWISGRRVAGSPLRGFESNTDQDDVKPTSAAEDTQIRDDQRVDLVCVRGREDAAAVGERLYAVRGERLRQLQQGLAKALPE